MVPIDFRMEKNTMEVKGDINFFFFFLNIFSFVFNRRNKLIQRWNNLRVSEWWQDFHCWVNYPFYVSDKMTFSYDKTRLVQVVKCSLSQMDSYVITFYFMVMPHDIFIH